MDAANSQAQHWSTVFATVDRAFGAAPRPSQFTDHPFCEECAEADEFFQNLDPEALEMVTEDPVTLPIPFLTTQAFHYFMPGLARWLQRAGPDYCAGDVLFHLENRLDTFDEEQRTALRDLLYVVYDALQTEIHESAFDYPTIWRILNQLDTGPRRPEDDRRRADPLR